MTMTQILYALAVAKYQNFSKAASSQFVSQPALSLQIKTLENELGYNIFIRNTHEVTLTELGKEFCEHARPLAEKWLDFQRQVYGQSRSGIRRLRIGLGSRVYSNHLFDEIVSFFDGHPELEVTFITEAGHDALTALKEGQLDLALDRMPPESLVPDAKGLTTFPLIEEQQCILMAKSDPRSERKEITFQELHGCTIITGLEDSIEDRILKYFCQSYGVVLNRIYRSDGIETNMNLLRSGKGIIIGPESFAEYYGVAAVPLAPRTVTSLDFICLKKNEDRTEIAALRKFLVKLCAERAARRA